MGKDYFHNYMAKNIYFSMEIVEQSRAVLLGRVLEKVISTDNISCKEGSYIIPLQFWLRSNAYGDIGSMYLARRKLTVTQKQCRHPRALLKAQAICKKQ